MSKLEYPKYNILLKLSDTQAFGLEILSKKTGMDYTNLIRQSIKELLEKELTEDEKLMVSTVIQELLDIEEGG